jgi:hypothetical protein
VKFEVLIAMNIWIVVFWVQRRRNRLSFALAKDKLFCPELVIICMVS